MNKKNYFWVKQLQRLLFFYATFFILILFYCALLNIHPISKNIINTAITTALAHLLSTVMLIYFSKFPGQKSVFSIFPSWLSSILMIVSCILLFRIEYSIAILIIGEACSIFFLIINSSNNKNQKQTLAYLPIGRAAILHTIKEANWVRLDSPHLPKEPFSALVVDLHASELSDEWQSFLADITLSGVPVLNVRQVEESLTGRVKITHMYENNLGSLLPSFFYLFIKRILDIIIVITTAWMTLPIILVTAIAIKLFDRGSILFSQDRVGFKGKPFKMLKFRSMKENSGTHETEINDKRITKIGHFIRRTRIDELPQLINVLKGDMSLIGPRAETTTLSKELAKSIPFFNYRNIIKPGISGWAQVMQGYTTGCHEAQIKIEYDFYYIKNISFSLDLLIFFKTIKTILFGFGHR